jgi:hypothetical protein
MNKALTSHGDAYIWPVRKVMLWKGTDISSSLESSSTLGVDGMTAVSADMFSYILQGEDAMLWLRALLHAVGGAFHEL